jgi:hypothetical protein
VNPSLFLVPGKKRMKIKQIPKKIPLKMAVPARDRIL